MKAAGDFNSVDEILEFAIEKEQEAVDFYTQWAGKVENRAVGEVFEEFVETEKAHKALLLDIKSGKKINASPKEIPDLSISDYLVESNPTEDMDYQTALMIAMQRETAASKLYSNLATKVTDESVKDLLQSLAREEARHKLKLETIYDDEILTEN